MDEILKQSPIDINEDIIKNIYEKNEKDISKTLMEIWNLKEEKKELNGISKENIDKYNKEQNEWTRIRDTCDEFDGEMNRIMSKIMKKK